MCPRMPQAKTSRDCRNSEVNIFVLDYDQPKCAEYHCNQHVVKMIIESVQMLSTACRLNGLDQGYKITHQNHPCSVWVRASLSNWKWLESLVYHLNEEFKFRFKGVDHKSFLVSQALSTPRIEDLGLTPFALAMPEHCRRPDPVEAYRCYYQQEKKFATWTKRDRPFWI